MSNADGLHYRLLHFRLFDILFCIFTSKLRSRVEIRGKRQREREACGLDRLSRKPKLNRFQSLRKHFPVPATFDHRRWAICQNLIFIYSGKHPEFNLLLRLLGFLSLSLSLFSSLLLSRYLRTPKDLCTICHGSHVCRDIRPKKNNRKPKRKTKAKSFGIFLSFQDRRMPPERQREDNETQEKLNVKKGRPRYALAVS